MVLELVMLQENFNIDFGNNQPMDRLCKIQNKIGENVYPPVTRFSANNQARHLEAESRISSFIQGFFARNNKWPSKRVIEKGAHCDWGTAKPHLDAIRREVERQQKKQRFFNLYNVFAITNKNYKSNNADMSSNDDALPRMETEDHRFSSNKNWDIGKNNAPIKEHDLPVRRAKSNILSSSVFSSNENCKTSSIDDEQANLTGLPTRKAKGHPFSSNAMQRLADAYNILKWMYPHDIYRLTFTFPSDTDEAHLALSQNSNQAVKGLIRNISELLPINERYWLWCWELQNRQVLHLHIDLFIPLSSIQMFTVDRLRSAWIKELDKIDELTGIDLYAMQNDHTHRFNKEVLHLHINKAETCYLPKPKSKYAREIFGGLKSSPQQWAGVSPSLSAMVRKQRIKNIIPVDTLDDAKQIVKDLLPLIPTNWKELSDPYKQIGFVSTIKLEQLSYVRKLLGEVGRRLCSQYKSSAADATSFVIFELFPNNFVKLRWRQKSNPLAREANSKKRERKRFEN